MKIGLPAEWFSSRQCLSLSMAKIERFEDIRAWQEARKLVKMVYIASSEGMMARDFDFRSQIRRASISCMNNIAEGFGRFSNKEFIRFLEISSASANEVKSLGYAAIDLTYWSEIKAQEVMGKAEHVKSLDLKFIKYLKEIPKAGPA